jgi:hypothetical protein
MTKVDGLSIRVPPRTKMSARTKMNENARSANFVSAMLFVETGRRQDVKTKEAGARRYTGLQIKAARA